MQQNEYMNSYMKDRYAKRRAEAVVSLGGVCVKCGSTDELEFDHVDRSTKIKSIGCMSSASKKLFEAELAKCQLLCSPCHLEKSKSEGVFSNQYREMTCACGKVFSTTKAYAGHKRWCS